MNSTAFEIKLDDDQFQRACEMLSAPWDYVSKPFTSGGRNVLAWNKATRVTCPVYVAALFRHASYDVERNASPAFWYKWSNE